MRLLGCITLATFWVTASLADSSNIEDSFDEYEIRKLCCVVLVESVFVFLNRNQFLAMQSHQQVFGSCRSTSSLNYHE